MLTKNQLEHAAKMVVERQQNKKQPKLYNDYRQFLAENKLDTVVIGTPRHRHALSAIDTIKSG
jgi:predicted dehydrogenase